MDDRVPMEPRGREQRVRDTLTRLANDVDAWVATADPATGAPYLVPLSFLWDGTTLLLATPATSPTGRNLVSTGRARIGVGTTRDVVMIEGTVEAYAATDIADDVAIAFAAKTGFDPRAEPVAYSFFRVRPLRVQAWREANELAGRDLPWHDEGPRP
jgi:hypothetical protein